ncbi:RNA polymerase sigma factor [Rapidithrix thailandica]|uniref:RNA polymerase sigma factor n=1 Tax=Rapidithrix thailandica TaxID=413964 RepID=A0AAW9SBW6_9BACT
MSRDKSANTKLLKACINNDRGAQKELYKLYYGYGMSICLRYADSKNEAAEILNDGFMKIFKYLKSFDLSKPFKPWFSRIMVNAAVDYFHKSNKKIETEELDKAREVADDANIIAGISYSEIIEIMQKLPPSYRTVFNLHVIEGYSHEEIAEQLGVSVGTTKSNLFKARKCLKEMLEKVLEKPYAG